jgi:hypothetical protein
MSQRPALAYSTEVQAHVDVRRRRGCAVVLDDCHTFWSVPLERLGTSGPWMRFAHVDPDPTPPHGLERPRPYDWAAEAFTARSNP